MNKFPRTPSPHSPPPSSGRKDHNISNTTALYILDNAADPEVVCGDYATCLRAACEWAQDPQVQESPVIDPFGVVHLGNDGGVAMTMTPVGEAVSSLTPEKACVVRDGATMTIYARPLVEVFDELRGLLEGDTYWCSEHDCILSTVTGDKHVGEIAEALGLPVIAFSGGRWT